MAEPEPEASGVGGSVGRKKREWKKSAKAIKVSRPASKRLSAVLRRSGKAVVVVGKKGKLKVYSLDGYERTSASAKRTKPWLRKDDDGRLLPVTAKEERKGQRTYVHWTKRPENKAKLDAMIRRTWLTRKGRQ